MEAQPYVQTLFGDVRTSPIRPQDRRVGHSPVEYRLTYINNLIVPVTVEWRSGIKFTLPAEPNMLSKDLIVRVEITLQHTVKLDIQRVLSAIADDVSKELKVMKESFQLSAQTARYGSATFILDYHLSLEQLKRYGGSIYYHELDCVFSMLDFENTPPHPYGEAGRQIQLVNDIEAHSSSVGFIYAIEIVDNAGEYGNRFINIGGKVYPIKTVKDNTRRNGVYVITNRPVEGQAALSEREVLVYGFDAAEEELCLYRTPEEARNFGDLSTAKREEVLALEHQLQIEKGEAAILRQQHDAELLEKQKALAIVEAARDENARLIDKMRAEEEHRMKLERERVKDYYDDRSYQRKDNNESLKFLPAIVVGIGAVIMAAKKWLS